MVITTKTAPQPPTVVRVTSGPRVVPGSTWGLDRPLSDADIGSHLAFSWKRCLFSIVGLVLALTDIPRTGYRLRLANLYPLVDIGTVAYYGPYEYPVNHLQVSSTGDIAGRNGSISKGIGLWPYKFDTMSIPLRAMATHLRLETFPPCILYKSPCPGPYLSPLSTLTMLDGLISALQLEYFASSTTNRQSIVIVTRSNWIDRLHHHIIKKIWMNQEFRWHAVHHYQFDPRSRGWLKLCTRRIKLKGDPVLPLFCNLAIIWRCAHPTNATWPRISIEEHINVRLLALQMQYPDLDLDLTIFSSRLQLRTGRLRGLPRLTMNNENIEITTLIRGRRCESGTSGQPCVTMFVDDYRYERAVCESDEDHWHSTTWLLRAAAQVYVWVRVIFLLVGCGVAHARECKYSSATVREIALATLTTFFKIPGYSIVYGSLFPICLYSMTHYIDSAVIHLVGEYVWASVNGEFKFDLFQFVQVASIQMRNVWLIALLWHVAVIRLHALLVGRCEKWRPLDGVLSFRGVFIGLTSSLTVFSFLRAMRFRDVDITSIAVYSRDAPLRGFSTSVNDVEPGFILDVKVMTIAFVIVITVALSLEAILRGISGVDISFLTCRTYYLAHCAGELWPTSMPRVLWIVHWAKPTTTTIARPRRHCGGFVVATMNYTHDRTLWQKNRQCRRCQPLPSYLNWPVAHGCVRHDHLSHVDRRLPKVAAALRLMNLAYMSDPLVLFTLYCIGKEIYLYKITGARNGRHDRTVMLTKLNRGVSEDDLSSEGMELVAVLDSAIVPWHIIVDAS